MAEYHTVEQGEYLGLIARNYGFASSGRIWNHDNNADLRNLRKDPNVLLAGDQIFVPDKQTKQAEITPGQQTRFKVQLDKILLRLVLDEQFGEPLTNAACEVDIDGQRRELTTNGDASLEFEVPATAKSILLTVKEQGSRLEGLVLPLKIGHLDPVEEETGQIARLDNLGYLAGSVDEPDEKLLASAVEEFQCDHGLTVDGKCGPKTQAKLKEIHGS